MPENNSLQDVMNAVSKRLDAMRVEDQSAAPDIMSELEAFAALDPLLADLQKQYLNLRLTRSKQEEQFGKDSPMAEVAMEVEDSAWCMAQTRYIELRKDRALMRRVQEMLITQRLTKQQAEELKKQTEVHNKAQQLNSFYHAQQTLQRADRRKSKSVFSWIWLFVYIETLKRSHEMSLYPSFRTAA